MADWTPHYRRSRPRIWLYPGLLTLCVLAGVLIWQRFAGPRTLHDPSAAPRAVTPRGNLSVAEKTTIEIFKAASPSVVHITNYEVIGRRRFRTNPMEIEKGTGTGFIWDSRGYIVTNYHVVAGGQRWRVTLHDNTVLEARAVGGSASKDIAVLKVDAPSDRLPPISIGRSADLEVGQWVFAIGNPFGLDQTLTTGVIGGLDRQIKGANGTPIKGVIQTDAAINPGNSGGPLLDSAGRLIGVNTAIVSPSGAYAGIGFAVPVDIVNQIVPRIIQSGNTRRPGIGAEFWSDAQARRWRKVGVVVREIEDGGPAARAGVQPSVETPQGVVIGDVIIGVDDTAIRSKAEFARALGRLDVGDTVRLTLDRQNRRVRVKLALAATEN